MDENSKLMTVDSLCNRVYTIRGQQVMLDYDLAEIYGYEVKRLNEQVKRNLNRFPEDFMFQLTKEEIPDEFLKSQIATLNESGNNRGLHIKKMPYAFTDWKKNTEKDILKIQENIDKINENFISDNEFRSFVIYKGQKFEADVAYIDIYQKAIASIYVVDDYMNAKTLQLLSQKRIGVEVILFTENGHGRKGFLTEVVVNDFIKQYPPLRLKPNPDCHDRWIILDYGLTTEQIYHCGASSKDAGKKICAINKIENSEVIHLIIDKLLLGEDKTLDKIT